MVPRRYIHSEPTSRLAIWARRIAGFAFVASLLAVIVVRSGLLEIKPALATFAGALAIAVLALLVAFAAFVMIWMEGLAGMGAALSAMAISLLLLAYPGYLGTRAYRLPWTYDAALAVVNKRRWRVVEARAPQAGRREGRIEAVARTAIMGFRDDVVIRVRAEPDGARVDARSSSRYGSFDFGTNAVRIRSLMNEIEDAIRAQKPERPPTPPPAKGKKGATGKKEKEQS